MKKLVIYLTFMYPNPKDFYATLDILEELQVDVVEFGIPVADPYLDGQLIQASHQQVLTQGITSQCFAEHLTAIRQRYHFDITLMTYKTGISEFDLLALPENLYDGLLCVDQLIETTQTSKLVQLFNEEMNLVDCAHKLANSSQFHYVMSGVGKTGTFDSVPTGYQVTIPFIKSQSTKPVYVGFGIKTAEEVQIVCQNGADGVIIGSSFMKCLNEEGLPGIQAYIRSLQAVLDK